MNVLRRCLEPRLLGCVAGAGLALWGFIEAAEEVGAGGTGALDRLALLALRMPGDPVRPLGPVWLPSVARDITALGSLPVLGLIVAAVALYLWLAGRRRLAALVVFATGSGALLSLLLKEAFNRPRPDLFMHGEYVASASFPSGHAMLSAVVYLTVGGVLAGLAPRRRLKIHVLGVALLLTVSIGVSRVYLGVHWPTDVLAGWAAGAAWAFGWWGAAEWFREDRR
ncbi:MAG TPA: phosphatase PAP2 family protein [Pseudomonas sp.]|nr:phosphatase PAP2 family protein [Pseudomonas sp.]